jgi:hypothetical protein
MPGAEFFEALTPLGRVAAAAALVVIALLIRFSVGRTRITEILLIVATSWFVVNVLIAPYAIEMQRDLHQVLRR